MGASLKPLDKIFILTTFFLPVGVEDEGDEEGDVEGGHTHPGAVILRAKNWRPVLDNLDGEADLHDGQSVEGEVGDGEDEGGGEEELGEVVEESPEEKNIFILMVFGNYHLAKG